MGWTYPFGSSRRHLIEERTRSWERQNGEMLVKTICLARCFRGGAFCGVLWSVWERTFTIDGKEARPTERWIGCDLMEYAKQFDGWGYKDLDESMHPFYYSCPLGYLEMVPLDKFGGNPEWRAGVMAYHQRQREKRKATAVARQPDHEQLRLPTLAFAIRNRCPIRAAVAPRNASEPSFEAAVPCSGTTTAVDQASACCQPPGAATGPQG